MDNNKGVDESSQAPHNRNNDIKPEDGQKVGGISADNSNEEHSQPSNSERMSPGGTVTEQPERSGLEFKSKKENDSASDQTIGIP